MCLHTLLSLLVLFFDTLRITHVLETPHLLLLSLIDYLLIIVYTFELTRAFSAR